MRILQVHKFFHPHAGSETALFLTRDLLQERGHEVVDFAMEHERNVASPDDWAFAPFRDYNNVSRPKARRTVDALSTVYSVPARRRIARLLDARRPDVAHLHLISHQLTFSVVDELSARGIPMVMTLHDYKIGCPAYVLYRNGHPCRLCVGGSPEHVLQHKCLKGSRAASALAAIEARLAKQRGSWDKIDIYIGPSRFAGQVAADSGVPRERIHVIQNFLPSRERAACVARLLDAPRFFIASRLEAVKGIRDLLAIYAGSSDDLGTLVIAGAGGELEDEVRAASANPRIEYLGRLSRDEVLAELRRSRAALVPSLWDENNPMSLLEARAAGVPVIATNVGGLPDMVEHDVDGVLVPRGDRHRLAAAIRRLATDRAEAERMGQAGTARLTGVNSPDTHYDALMHAYGEAMRVSSNRRKNATAR